MSEDELKLNEIIHNNFVDASDKLVPKELTYMNISKIIFERYVGNKRVNIKIFFYSKGKVGNNKPYTLNERTEEEFNIFNDLLNKCRDKPLDIFGISSNNAKEITPFTQPIEETAPSLVEERSDASIKKDSPWDD